MFVLLSALLLVPVLIGAEPCSEKPISNISSLWSLQRSILCNEYNMESLLQSFFPANRRHPQMVQVNYYINRTAEHPLVQFKTNKAEKVAKPDYVFFWVSSSVLVFLEAVLLEVISLRLVVFDVQYAYISIPSFSSDDEDWIISLLSNATIWLRSYAENGVNSLYDGVTISSQGFSSYRQNIDDNDNSIHNPPPVFLYYAGLLVVFLVFTSIVASIGVPIIIYKKYPILYTLSKRQKRKNEKFKFRNLLWGLVLALGMLDSAIYSFYIWNIHSVLKDWRTRYTFLYPLLVCVVVMVLILSFISSIIIVIKATKKCNIIFIPDLFYQMFCIEPPNLKEIQNIELMNKKYKLLLIIWQVYGVFAVIVLIVPAVIFFGCLFTVLFLDPVQAITNVGIYLSIFFCIAYTFVIVFEVTDLDELKEKRNRIKSRIKLYIKFFILFVIMTLIIFLVGIFGYTYATIVFYAGGSNQFNPFSSVGELLPVLLASAIGWALKHQFATYLVPDSNENENELEEIGFEQPKDLSIKA